MRKTQFFIPCLVFMHMPVSLNFSDLVFFFFCHVLMLIFPPFPEKKLLIFGTFTMFWASEIVCERKKKETFQPRISRIVSFV